MFRKYFDFKSFPFLLPAKLALISHVKSMEQGQLSTSLGVSQQKHLHCGIYILHFGTGRLVPFSHHLQNRPL